ncbi:MAG: SDR family NAD(P)-dependent oxidoreductase, partial [Polyangiaceae bacterium]|nr:SDR family NAD(P)-dependent oxidoreductase [Polyangiaceae bacterium]
FAHYTKKQGFCSLGTTKANLGHAQMAAGIIGVIKVLLALEHRKLPPLVHFKSVNENIALDGSPFYVHTDLRDWDEASGAARSAAVTSLGASGTNAHVVLEEAPQARHSTAARRSRLVVLSARTRDALREQAVQLARYCDQHQGGDLADISHTLLLGRRHFEHRLTCVAEGPSELGAALRLWSAAGAGEGIATSSPGERSENAWSAALVRYRATDPRFAEQAVRFLRGETPEFAALFTDGVRRRVPLPTYPFDRSSYWIPKATSSAAQAVTPAESVATTTVTGDDFFVRDHRVQGSCILPGAMFLELARAASCTSAGRAPARLENIVFLRPLAVTAGAVVIQTTLRAANAGVRFEISGRKDASSEPILHCQGDVSFEAGDEPARVDVRSLIDRYERVPDSPDEFYAFCRRLGVEYGPAFRGCVAAHTGPGGVLGEIVLPEAFERTLERFPLHPTMVDSALQGMVRLAASGEDTSRPRVLFAIKSVQLFAPCARKMWTWMRYAEGSDKIDLDLVDESGRVCVAMRGITARRVAAAEAKSDDSAAMTFLPVWEVVTQVPAETWPAPGSAVAVADGGRGASRAIADLFPGATVLDIATDAPVDEIERRLCAAPSFDHLFWIARDVAGEPLRGDRIIRGQSEGAVRVFRIANALLAAGYGKRPLGWTLVTRRTQALHDADDIDPTHAGIAGLIGALAKEQPKWRLRPVDIPDDGHASFERVLRLAADPDGNTRILRNGQWFQQALSPFTPTRTEAPCAFRTGGTYVIAGGAGGLGRALTEHLASAYRAQVVWLGRRPMDEQLAGAIAQAGRGGPVPHYIQADATRAESVRSAHEQIRERFGPVSGLVNSTLVFSGASLAKMSEAQFCEVLASKVDASVRLVEEFTTESLHCAVFLSSINSYLKAMAQSNYAAACTFMDAFAIAVRRTHGCAGAKVLNLGYCFNNASETNNRNAAVSKEIAFIERGEFLTGVETLVAGPMRQMTLMRLSQSMSTRGMTIRRGAAAITARQTAALVRPQGGTAPDDLVGVLADLPAVRGQLRELIALTI